VYCIIAYCAACIELINYNCMDQLVSILNILLKLCDEFNFQDTLDSRCGQAVPGCINRQIKNNGYRCRKGKKVTGTQKYHTYSAVQKCTICMKCVLP
jgi:hypothetical protein